MRHWYRRGALARLLWPASLAFGFIVFCRRILYRLRVLKSIHPGIPVVIVGNLTAGGSGKTPLVLWIAELLKARGWSPVIVISADAAATHQSVVRVMEAARIAGLSQITFTTQSNK